MDFVVASKIYGSFVLLCLIVKEIQSCNYAFDNLDNSIDLDWSSSVGSLVYTVHVKDTFLDSLVNDVPIAINSSSLPFKLSDSNMYQVLVKECLTNNTDYDLVLIIDDGGSCSSGKLTISTVSATPVYNMKSSDLVTHVDESVFGLFTDAFTIVISTDSQFGGCGKFECGVVSLNDGQQFVVDRRTFVVEIRRMGLKYGFSYNIKVTCFDSADLSFHTPSHEFLANITFYVLTTTSLPTPTTDGHTSTETDTSLVFRSATLIASSTKTSILTEAKTSEGSTEDTSTVSTPKQQASTRSSSITVRAEDQTKAVSSTVFNAKSTKSDPETTTIDIRLTASEPLNTSLADKEQTVTTTKSTMEQTIFSTTKSVILLTTAYTLSTAAISTNTGMETKLQTSKNSSPTATTSEATDSGSTTAFTITGTSGTVSPNSIHGNTNFFGKTKHIVTVAVPGALLGIGTAIGIFYFIYRKQLKKSNINPVLKL